MRRCNAPSNTNKPTKKAKFATPWAMEHDIKMDTTQVNSELAIVTLFSAMTSAQLLHVTLTHYQKHVHVHMLCVSAE